MTPEQERKALCSSIQFNLRHAADKLDEGQNRMIYVQGYIEEALEKIQRYKETFNPQPFPIEELLEEKIATFEGESKEGFDVLKKLIQEEVQNGDN